MYDEPLSGRTVWQPDSQSLVVHHTIFISEKRLGLGLIPIQDIKRGEQWTSIAYCQDPPVYRRTQFA